MRQGENILDTLADMMGADSTPLPGKLLVEICDQKRVVVENHRGVIGYSCNEVQVKLCRGCLCIGGVDLSIHKMSKEQLVVTGRIDSILFREMPE